MTATLAEYHSHTVPMIIHAGLVPEFHSIEHPTPNHASDTKMGITLSQEGPENSTVLMSMISEEAGVKEWCSLNKRALFSVPKHAPKTVCSVC